MSSNHLFVSIQAENWHLRKLSLIVNVLLSCFIYRFNLNYAIHTEIIYGYRIVDFQHIVTFYNFRIMISICNYVILDFWNQKFIYCNSTLKFYSINFLIHFVRSGCLITRFISRSWNERQQLKVNYDIINLFVIEAYWHVLVLIQ